MVRREGEGVRRGVAGRHGGTVLFLGKAMFCGFLIIWLAQYISSPSTCLLPLPPEELPTSLHQLLLEPDSSLTWRCPYDESSSMSYRFKLVPAGNQTLSNMTAITVMSAMITPELLENENIDVLEQISSMCSFPSSCSCLASVLSSPHCYLHTQSGPTITLHHDERVHTVFNLYFLGSIGMLGVMLTLYCCYRGTRAVCCEKRSLPGEQGQDINHIVYT